MKIKITIEIETDSAPSPETVEKAGTQADLREWIEDPTAHGIGEETREELIRSGIAQEIVDASTVPQLLALQEKYNAQIGRPKANYNDGRKIHSCSRCGAPHRKSQERLNGCCLDCHGLELPSGFDLREGV